MNSPDPSWLIQLIKADSSGVTGSTVADENSPLCGFVYQVILSVENQKRRVVRERHLLLSNCLLWGFCRACDKGVEHSDGELEANGFIMKQIAKRTELHSLNVWCNNRKMSIIVKQQKSMEISWFWNLNTTACNISKKQLLKLQQIYKSIFMKRSYFGSTSHEMSLKPVQSNWNCPVIQQGRWLNKVLKGHRESAKRETDD